MPLRSAPLQLRCDPERGAVSAIFPQASETSAVSAPNGNGLIRPEWVVVEAGLEQACRPLSVVCWNYSDLATGPVLNLRERRNNPGRLRRTRSHHPRSSTPRSPRLTF